MKFYIRPLILLLILLIMFLLPTNKGGKKSELDKVFDKWSEKIAPSKLDSFKSSTIDSAGSLLKIFAPLIDSIHEDICQDAKLNGYVDSLFSCNIPMRKTCLGIAFHSYLNGENFLKQKVCYKAMDITNYNCRITEKEDEKINARIVIENFDSVKVGDSLFLMLPVDSSYGHKRTFYTMGYPCSIKYDIADDSLSVKGVLKDKYFYKPPDLGFDSTDIIFKIQIVALSDSSVEIDGGENKIGGQFDFYLQTYGRIIKHW